MTMTDSNSTAQSLVPVLGLKSAMASKTFECETLLTIDDLLVQRAKEQHQTPVVGCPRSDDGITDFLCLTTKELDAFTDAAANVFLSRGMRQVPSNDSENIALLGPSDLEFIISMFALSRLGYTILILSPRLPVDAYVSLLKVTNSSTICYALSLESTVSEIQKIQKLHSLQMLHRRDFINHTTIAARLDIVGKTSAAKNKVAFIMHSSGSTGMPKPIFQTHEACLENYSAGHELRSLLTVPLYHTHGHACLYRAIFRRSTIYLMNSRLSVTSTSMISMMKVVKPEIIFTVPYILKILAESQRGIESMQKCKIVSSSGSQIPDDLGDRLVAHGIQLISHWGSTETGALMSSVRPEEDKDWAYMEIFPSARPFILMRPLGADTYELVILEGLKSKIASNSDDPPNSFYTRDTFTPHPFKEGRWKYSGRLDDRVTLINGEKVLPTLMEGRLREDSLVREAVVFGTGRTLPGLLLFRSTLAADLSDDEFVERLWPLIELTNLRVESFAQIAKETIAPVAAEVDYPRTDKGTIIRPQVYKTFEAIIDNIYDRVDNSAGGTLRLDQAGIERFILDSFKEQCSINLPSVDADFFSAGADSLHAIKLASFLKRHLYLGSRGERLKPTSIFEQATTARLARFLVRLRESQQACEDEHGLEVMASMINAYSKFKPFMPAQSSHSFSDSVMLTGASGSLGIRILATLLGNSKVHKIYCLVRAPTTNDAARRILAAFSIRGISVPRDFESRVAALPSDLAREDLGLEPEMHLELRRNVSLVIHNAWAVNFNLSISSFEDQHIKGTHNLLQFALSVQRPYAARFVFCSSISVASKLPPPVLVSEAPIKDLSAANMGYGQSKLVAEHIISNAALVSGINCCVIRIGQIVGDSQFGLWNHSELIPLVIRSSLVVGCLPELNELCSWLPVDFVAKSIVEIGDNISKDPQKRCRFYHIVNPKSFSWTDDLLPALKDAGLSFESVSPVEWLGLLRRSEQDPNINPTIKLMSSYEAKYGAKETETGFQKKDSNFRAEIAFATEKTRADSDIMNCAPDIMREGYVKTFVARWLEQWQAPVTS